jgi:hypothetical protein
MSEPNEVDPDQAPEPTPDDVEPVQEDLPDQPDEDRTVVVDEDGVTRALGPAGEQMLDDAGVPSGPVTAGEVGNTPRPIEDAAQDPTTEQPPEPAPA